MDTMKTWENDYALPPKTPNVFAIPGSSNTLLGTKTKVGKTTAEEPVAQKWQNRYESRSRGQLPSVKRFPSPKFEPDHPETPGIKRKPKYL